MKNVLNRTLFGLGVTVCFLGILTLGFAESDAEINTENYCRMGDQCYGYYIDWSAGGAFTYAEGDCRLYSWEGCLCVYTDESGDHQVYENGIPCSVPWW